MRMYHYLLTQNHGSGTEFEEQVAYVLRMNGFSAKLTGNDDRGVDIIAQAPTAGNPKFLIQCKYQNSNINLTPVQEIFTGVALRDHIGHPVVFTTSHVTETLYYTSLPSHTYLCYHKKDLMGVAKSNLLYLILNHHFHLLYTYDSLVDWLQRFLYQNLHQHLHPRLVLTL